MTTAKIFDGKRQFEAWRNGLAKELNGALAHAKSCRVSADIIDSMVSRIAEFEEIESITNLDSR
jgi:hypothetical protein